MFTPVTLHRKWKPYSWSHMPFRACTWPELAGHYWDMARRYPDLLAQIQIIESVIDSGVADLLAGTSTISALNVVATNAIEPPYSVIAVSVQLADLSTPASVEISHISSSWQIESVRRPVDDAVPLFWRFVGTKFGIEANYTPTPAPGRG